MGEPRFGVWARKASPGYNPYGTTYTERQLGILSGALSLEEVRLSELAILVKKAERIEDMETREIAERLYEHKKDPQAYFPNYTLEEARGILQRLTPWKIQWK